MNYFEKHIGDYLKDTSHLSLLEHGIYNRLFDVYYTREGAIPDDQAARLIGARTRDEKAALKDVLQEFFDLRDGCWHQARCDEEISKYMETEPEREQKRENEKDRQRRSRERRRTLFDLLRENGIVPAYDAPMSELQKLASPYQSQPVMRDKSRPVTRDATGTHTHSPIPNTHTQEETAGAVSMPAPGVAGSICKAMRQAGIPDGNPSHPDLVRLVAAGVTEQEFADTAAEVKVKKFAYVLRAVEGRRTDAAAKGQVAGKTDPDDWTRHAA